MKGLIGHIHLSDCDGKVHGDMPAGMGVTPIKEYLQAIVDTGYEGTVSIELEYAPEGTDIIPWAQRAYDGTAAIMRDVGVRPDRHPSALPQRHARERVASALFRSALARSVPDV